MENSERKRAGRPAGSKNATLKPQGKNTSIRLSPDCVKNLQTLREMGLDGNSDAKIVCAAVAELLEKRLKERAHITSLLSLLLF